MDKIGVTWLAIRHVAEERMDGSKTQIAAACGIPMRTLQMLEETRYKWSIKIMEEQGRRLFVQILTGIFEQ